jgi:hypothetical protein
VDTTATAGQPKVTLIIVDGFVDGTPAQEAQVSGKIRIGDVLKEVNGSEVMGLTFDQVPASYY